MRKNSKLILFLSCFFYSVNSFAFNFNTTSSTISVGTGPSGIAYTPNGQYVYIANKLANTVSVINASTKTVITTITGFDAPNSVTINPAGTKVYVTNSNPAGVNTVSVITVATNTVTATIAGFNGPYAMAITSDGLFGYVVNYGTQNPPGPAGSTVRYVNLTTNTISGAAITVGNNPTSIAITPDDHYVYVTNYMTGVTGSGTVSVIDSNTSASHVATFNTVIKTIAGFYGPRQIVINPTGTYAYVANYGNNSNPPPTSLAGTTVSVIDLNGAHTTTFNTIVKTIQVGSQPSGIAIDPAGNYAYVTLYAAGGVGSLITLQLVDNTVLAPSVTLGKGPIQVAVLPNGLSLYALNYVDNTATILSIQNTFVITLLNTPANQTVTVVLNNIYPVQTNCISSFQMILANLFNSYGLTSTNYSIYVTIAQLLQKPVMCTTIGYPSIPICPLTPQGLRIFVEGLSTAAPFGGTISLSPNFYYDLSYADIPVGANSFNIDFTTLNAQLVTTGGTTSYAGTIFVIPDNYSPC